MNPNRNFKTSRKLAAILLAAAMIPQAVFFAAPSITAAAEADTAESEQDTAAAVSEEEGAEMAAGTEASEARVEELLASLTLEEKVCQLFVITPEALTGFYPVTMATDITEYCIGQTPVGGLLYMAENLENSVQIRTMISETQRFSKARVGLPLLICVDEEGGSVRRINGRGINSAPDIPSMQTIGASGDPEQAYSIGCQLGAGLKDLGFNVDFAPVADTLTNSENQIVQDRCFSSDPWLTAQMTASLVSGIRSCSVAATLKHFPGHGSTSGDTHAGMAVSYQTMDDLLSCDLIPFQFGIDAGADLVMTGHFCLPEVTGDMTPASLSGQVINGILRTQLGYQGIVITDALQMGAITESYTSSEAAVLALEAGNDMLLMPADFESARLGVLNAVTEGRISEDRIDESVRRILRLKLRFME